MTTHRKQFGKRGSDWNTGTQWGQSQPQYAAQSAAPAYSSVGNIPGNYESNSGFSLGAALWSIVALFFSFNGRINRLSYWGLSIFNSIIQFAIVKIYFSHSGVNWTDAEAVVHDLIYGEHSLNLIILLLLPSLSNLSLTVRRLHDRDVSGMWIVAWFIPILGSIICLFQTFANLFFAGTSGHNRFDSMQIQAKVFD
jgi:uncharacterized membrane protein YhaH (DUF805 family)